MESVEVGAKTVDEAIDIALEDLGLKRSQVSIEVLTPGKPGLFGLGGEQARVRVTALEEGTARPALDEEEPEELRARAPRGLPGEREEPDDDVTDPATRVEVKDLDAEEVDAAGRFLRQLLDLMQIDAGISAREPETPADGVGRATAVLDIEGDDLGLLIGRRGNTLSALQYLVNVMVTRKLDSRVLMTIDVEHYHRRREETLRNLALRMADRVLRSRRPITLEPMPASERRIIHISLADHPDVDTGSVGTGDERKVVIRPRRDGGGGPGNDRDYNR
jgi:spoIIIJ-associated protein